MLSLYRELFETLDHLTAGHNSAIGLPDLANSINARRQSAASGFEFAPLDQELIILTPNQRLALSLQTGYQTWSVAGGKLVWPRCPSIAFDSWLDRLWSQWSDSLILQSGEPPINPASRKLLTGLQESSVWETVINSSQLSDELLRPSACAQLAMKADQLLYHWSKEAEVQLEKLGSSELNVDVQSFMQWRQAFNLRCEEAAWITKAQSILALIEWIRSSPSVKFPKQVLLCGFEELSVLQRSFFDSLAGQGCVVEQLDLKHSSDAHAPTVYSFLDQTEEWRSAARWAKAYLAPYGEADSSAGAPVKVAIVVPNLAQVKSELEYTLCVELVPNYLSNSEPVNPRPYFNLSAGDPLASFAMIRAAITLLRWTLQPIALDDVICSVQSVFITGGVAERHQRAVITPVLHKLGATELSIARFKQVCRSINAKLAPGQAAASQLVDLFEQLSPEQSSSNDQALESFRGLKSHRAWLDVFQEKLRVWGWPGDKALNTDEFQQYQKWQTTLEQVAELDLVNAKVRASDALASLKKVMERTVFQPQSQNQCLFVMGTLEALGQDFDAVWIVGANNQTLPDQASPNPFIPYSYQVENRFPRSSAERELKFATTVRDQLLQYYPTVIFSWTSQADGNEIKASSILDQWSVQSFDASSKITPRHSDPLAIEDIEEEFLPLDADEKVTGGAGLLKAQTECSFKAFARHRLRAEPHEKLTTGLSSAERGQLIHFVMEQFWETVKSYTALKQLIDSEMQAILLGAATTAIERIYRIDSPLLKNTEFLIIERRRLSDLAMAWLEVEKLRSDFEVLAVEQKQEVSVAGLKLKLQVDRIDRLPSGNYLIIDYKTGKCSINAIDGEALREPQLPLYCIADKTKVSAIAFSELRLGEEKFLGLADINEDEIVSKGIKTVENWNAQVDLWDAQLQSLAMNFSQGQILVKPLNAAKDCMYCSYSSLCRIGEQQ